MYPNPIYCIRTNATMKYTVHEYVMDGLTENALRVRLG